jgi:hypothetical protein
MTEAEPSMMKALYLKTYGKPLDVLRLKDVAVPNPRHWPGSCASSCLRTQSSGLGRVRGLPACSSPAWDRV